MTIYSYVAKRFEDGGRTGVPRFDSMLRDVFPGMLSVTSLPEFQPDDLVITDNHLSLDVPDEVRTVVVHHGSAKAHFERDEAWRNSYTAEMVIKQREMYARPNRSFVAPSMWVAEEFGARLCDVIPHWAEEIPRLPRASARYVIIGDWRDNNKGAGIWRKLAERCPQWQFSPLDFRTDEGRRQQYGTADLYLCLSLSEGGSYSMCDAEAASLPIVSTDVGNYMEFDDCEVIRWQDRDNLDLVAAAIDRKLHQGRRKPSFYKAYTFPLWQCLWRETVGRL